MGGLKQALEGLFNILGLPPWGIFLIGGVIVAFMIRGAVRNAPVAKVRALVARASLTGSSKERLRMEQLALDRVWDNPSGLIAVAQEALRRGRRPLARKALDRVRALQPTNKDLPKLQLELDAPPPTPEVAALAIQRLLNEGLLEEAQRRMARARARWPQATQLDDLERELAQTSEE